MKKIILVIEFRHKRSKYRHWKTHSIIKDNRTKNTILDDLIGYNPQYYFRIHKYIRS